MAGASPLEETGTDPSSSQLIAGGLKLCAAVLKFQARPRATFPALPTTSVGDQAMGWACSGGTADRPPLPRLLGQKPSHFPKVGNWKFELLQVSEQLEARLQDPQFVATRCDLDGSGDLDMHELKQAARAFGLKFSAQKLEALMMGSPRISKANFAEIVATSDNLPGHELVKLHRAIPHSLRGMALGQLEHLESLFVTSNWLGLQCQSFNKDHADDIQDKKVYKQAPNLYAMDQYVVTPMSKPGTCAARKHDRKNTVPQTNVQTSFSELLNAHGLYVHCFVSHFWGHLYSKTLQSLRLWSQNNFQQMGCEQPKAMVFWICLFALNQHEVAEEVGNSPNQGPFNAALAQAEAAVMILDEHIHPFKRIWCLFEVHRLGELHKPFELICEVGSLSQPGARSSDEAALDQMMKATCTALWKMSAGEAEASVQKDKYQIWREIINPRFQSTVDTVGLESAFEVGSSLVSEPLPTVPFLQFDLKVKSLLSTCMLLRCVAQADYCMAMQCCSRGARFSEEQLTAIRAHAPETEESHWLSYMLCGAAQNGSVEQVQLLLSAGEGLEASVVNPEHCPGRVTPLMCAAGCGHEAVARLLLESGADVSASNVDGDTALLRAAGGGHETVSKLLLDHRADATVQDQRGATALINVSQLQGDHEFEGVAKLLLDHGVDLEARDSHGICALMNAARWGNMSMVRRLINHRADVEAADNNGITALMMAAGGGHEKVARLLMEHGAIVGAARMDGTTALMYAALSGDEATTKLLLAGTADVATVTKKGRTCLQVAAARGHISVTRLMLEHRAEVDGADTNGATPMILAASNGHASLVRLLLDGQADAAAADSTGCTALMRAAGSGHQDAATLLLAAGGPGVTATNINGDTPLMLAAQSGHESMAKLLLKNHADVAATNKDDHTALHAAAHQGHASLIRLLMENRAGVDAAAKDGLNPLMLAAEGGHSSTALLLLNHQANVAAADQAGDTSLMLAARHGHEVVVKLLLEHRADVRTTTGAGTALLAASDRGHTAVTGLLLKSRADVTATSPDGITPVMAAACRGHASLVKLLLDKRGDAAAADSSGRTALMLAAHWGHQDAATLLLAARGPGVAATNINGDTPLMLAAQGGHESMAKLLLKNRADVAAANKNGYTALLLAAFGGHETVAKLLLDHQANVAAADGGGRTSLMLAAQNSYDDIVRLLLENRANLENRDCMGNTALMIAAFYGHESTSKLLLEKGAQAGAVNGLGRTAAQRAAVRGHDNLVLNLRLAELAENLRSGVPREEATRGLIVTA